MRLLKRIGYKAVYSTSSSYTSAANNLIENNLLEINRALVDSGKPLVALESTIITHGMPYPKNVEMALEVENEIQEFGKTKRIIYFLSL